jgi:hypothetical protein
MKAWERKRRDCGANLTKQILREEDESLGEKKENLLFFRVEDESLGEKEKRLWC